MIFGLFIYYLSLRDLTTSMPNTRLRAKDKAKEEEDSKEEVKEGMLQQMLSTCLKSAFEEYLKVKLLQKEIDTTQQNLDKD